MQEVEDGITGLAALERAAAQAQRRGRERAARARARDQRATRAASTTYLDVITAQQALLNSERLAAQLQGQRLLTSVFLVKALGGDWQAHPRRALCNRSAAAIG